jgi:Raf kinase inhibitor-like YbhB/YbcL family protein
MSFTLSSSAFEANELIPRKFTGDGEGISPPLSWSDPPAETQQFALICDDPDAPTPQPWVHWLLYCISKDIRSLPAGLPKARSLRQLAGAMQGCNSWGPKYLGYCGPAPPRGHGVHHYHFRLFALDKALKLKPGVDKQMLLKVIDGHILGEAEVVGLYQR